MFSRGSGSLHLMSLKLTIHLQGLEVVGCVNSSGGEAAQ